MSYGKINKNLVKLDGNTVQDEKSIFKRNRSFSFPTVSREIVSKKITPQGNTVYKTTIENMTCKGHCTIESNFNMRLKK